MSTTSRELTDTDILLHLCRALAVKGLLTDDDAHDDNEKETACEQPLHPDLDAGAPPHA